VSGAISDGGGTSTINVNGGGTLQARSLGTAASRIDTLTLNSATVVVDISAGLPSGAWGYASSFNPTATTVGLNFAPGTLSGGQTIHAIDYTNLGGGGFAALSMAKQPARVTAHLANGANTVDIVIDSADSPKWDGAAGVNGWDIGTTNNWKLIGAGTATNYQEDLVNYSTTDAVLFNDDAAETNVNLNTTVAPNSIAVNNPTKSYSFTGSGKITGTTGITKQGAGSLMIGNSGGNDFSGAIDIQGGTVSTSASNVLPDGGTINVSSAGGAFSLGDNSDTVGAVTVAGGNASVHNGTLNVGTIGVTAGNLAITGNGTIAANIMNFSGSTGTVSLGSGSLTATTLNLSNTATLTPGGSLSVTTVNVDNATIAAGPLAASAINVSSSGTIAANVSGVATLTKTSAGTLTLSGNSTYTGLTRLEDGNILVTSNNALGAAGGGTTIENGGNTGAGALQLSGNISIAEPILLSGRRGFTPTNTGPYNFNPHIVNVSGNNTITGNITLSTGGTNHNIGSDAGKLTISGNVIDAITTSPALTRFLHLRGAGDGEISGNIQVTGSESQDIIKLDGGTWTLSGSANAQMQNTTVQGGKLVLAGPLYRTKTIDVQGTTSAEVASGGGSNRVLTADTVTIAAGAKLDLRDNKLITKVAPGTSSGGTYNGLQGQVQRAYDFNAWDQPGLTTSMPDAAAGLTTIGISTGEQMRGLGPTDTDTFAGQTITGASTIAMYTYAGDANLDGVIDGGDYGTIDNFVQVPGADGYANGDFNYDGVIDGGDYGVIDNNIQAQGPGFPTSGSATATLSGVTAVPEPSAFGFAILTAAGLLRRRRRRASR
jgi:autotransporter-associated beta strand protein